VLLSGTGGGETMEVGEEANGRGDIVKLDEMVVAARVDSCEKEKTVRGVVEETEVSVEVSLGIKGLFGIEKGKRYSLNKTLCDITILPGGWRQI